MGENLLLGEGRLKEHVGHFQPYNLQIKRQIILKKVNLTLQIRLLRIPHSMKLNRDISIGFQGLWIKLRLRLVMRMKLVL